jgi:hypothetical protein
MGGHSDSVSHLDQTALDLPVLRRHIRVRNAKEAVERSLFAIPLQKNTMKHELYHT